VEPLVIGDQLGLGSMQDITYAGDALENFVQADFRVNRSSASTTTGISILSTSLMRRFTSPRPVIDPIKCIRCGQCVNICPVNPKALAWHSNERIDTPFYDYAKCIRCYCCQETCPAQAISVKIPLLGKLIRR
jgi:MinD superfamily P-loop ATPase